MGDYLEIAGIVSSLRSMCWTKEICKITIYQKFVWSGKKKLLHQIVMLKQPLLPSSNEFKITYLKIKKENVIKNKLEKESSSSSSWCANCTNSLESLSPSIPTNHRSWQVLLVASSVHRELVNVSFCWSADTGVSIWESCSWFHPYFYRNA